MHTPPTALERDDHPKQAPTPLLKVSELNVVLERKDTHIHVVRDVSFSVAKGQALGILGESGSGKSVSVKSLMGLLPRNSSTVHAETARLGDTDLLKLTEKSRGKTIGPRISIIFQDALSALNPVHPVGRQIAEMYRVHRGTSRVDARRSAVEMMRRVRIPDPENRYHDYPHQFSGGMRQRICIAIALSLDPDLVIADEPTTALDVTVQSQVLDLLKTEQSQRGMGLVLISHDISVISEMTDFVTVMYAGRIVEQGPTASVLHSPGHPYTQGLSESSKGGEPGLPMTTIPGLPPNLQSLPRGCSFAPRCHMAQDICTQEQPPLRALTPERSSACHFAEDLNS